MGGRNATPQLFGDIVSATTFMWDPLTIANVSYKYLQTMENYTLIHNSTFDRDFGKLRLTFNDAKDYCDQLNAR